MSGSIACVEPSLPLHTLRQRLAERLGPGIGVACTGIDGNPQALSPQEFATIQRAVPRRQREFAAGREAARQAMAQIGWLPVAIPSASDRSPIWPDGLSGSITHTHRACVAVVAPRAQIGFVGIDLEEDQPMDPALWDSICTSEERELVNKNPTEMRGSFVKRLFSAKEAFYKWQYPQTRRMLDFQDVCIAPSQTGFPERFRIILAQQHATPNIEGRVLACHGHLFTWVIGHA